MRGGEAYASRREKAKSISHGDADDMHVHVCRNLKAEVSCACSAGPPTRGAIRFSAPVPGRPPGPGRGKWSVIVVGVKQHKAVSWGPWGARGAPTGGDAYVGLVGVEDLLLAADKDITEAARALECVYAGGEGQGQSII